MIHKPIDAVRKEDIEALISGSVPEGRTIEYKLTLPGTNDEARKEFLADVSSFANASGGDLIYGVAAKAGIPQNAPGLSGATPDKDILRLEEMIRTGIEPRIVGLKIVEVKGFSGPVLLIRIPQSFNSPHVVWFKQSSRFYTRNSKGKYQMDVAEIRIAFDASGSVSKRLENFRADRLGKIVAGETPATIPSSSFLILHILPLPMFSLTSYLGGDLQNTLLDSFPPLDGGLASYRNNLDGFVTLSYAGADLPDASYCQLFRTGAVESICGEAARLHNGYRGVASTYYERRLIAVLRLYLQGLKKLQVPPPFYVALTLTGVKGAIFWTNLTRTRTAFDRDSVVLPGVVVDEYDKPSDQILRPVFDSMWNAAGAERCYHYDDLGKWSSPE